MLLLQIYYTNLFYTYVIIQDRQTDTHTCTCTLQWFCTVLCIIIHSEGHSDITITNQLQCLIYPIQFGFRLEERPWNPTDGTVLTPHHFLSDSQQWWVTESQDCWYFPGCPGHWLSSRQEFEEKGPWQFDQRAVVLVGSPSVLAGRLGRPGLAVGAEMIVGGVAPPL